METPESKPVLELDGVSMRYTLSKKDTLALQNVSFRVGPGVYGLLGPNGAGKSTLMNIVTTCLAPTRGVVYFGGRSVQKMGKQYRKAIGYMPQQQALYDGFSGLDFLFYMASLKEIPYREVTTEIRRVSELNNLGDFLQKKTATYSGGMKQRLLCANAMLGAPQLFVFDEPSAGLDPKERVRLRSRLEELGKESIVIVATHVVSDIESIADEVLLLKKGKLVAKDTTQQLIFRYPQAHSLEDVYMNVFNEEAHAYTD